MNRFHLPGAETGAVLPLAADEAAHAVRVLRLGPGAPVAVFDGRGHEFAAAVATAGRDGVTVLVGAAAEAPAPEPGMRITLVMGVLKADHMDGVVRDATMLGVSAICPLVSARAETSFAALARGARVARWHRVAIASAKQCGRAVVPAIGDPVSLADLLARRPGADERWLACVEPSAPVASDPAHAVERPSAASVTLLVGPEGGWDPGELERLAPVARFVRLGGRTLRAEAAPLVALSALLGVWGEL